VFAEHCYALTGETKARLEGMPVDDEVATAAA